VDHSYRDYLAKGNTAAASPLELLALIPRWNIDWNSCEFRDGVILDSWGTPAEVGVDPATIHLRSAGPDRRFNTADDIAATIPNSKGS
jgi:hypothetical protein